MSDAQAKQPDRSPGEAEAPAQGTTDHTVEQAIRKTDKTEPVQAGKPRAEKE